MVLNTAEGNADLTGLLCKVLLQQGVPKDEIESFDANPINYQYFTKL